VGEQRLRSRAGTGQHFLVPRLAADLVRNSGVTRGDLVVEIGAGTGVLTSELAARAGRVTAVETDAQLTARLRARFAREPRVRVVGCDALELRLPREPFRVVANLPFGHTTELLRKLFDDPSSELLRADVIVQWGTAVKRCSQRPSTLLTVCWAPWWELTITRKLAPTSFRPPPPCDCAVMTVTRRPDPLLDVRDRDAFAAFVAVGFERLAHATELDAWEWADAFRRAGGSRRGDERPHRRGRRSDRSVGRRTPADDRRSRRG
jgi:23S rRNA (adenine-N6)-dimethyltransferase